MTGKADAETWAEAVPGQSAHSEGDWEGLCWPPVAAMAGVALSVTGSPDFYGTAWTVSLGEG